MSDPALATRRRSCRRKILAMLARDGCGIRRPGRGPEHRPRHDDVATPDETREALIPRDQTPRSRSCHRCTGGTPAYARPPSRSRLG